MKGEPGELEVPRFTGKAWDEHVGLYYFNARWYDAALGRFVGEDPFPGEADKALSYNRFSYCMNSPVMQTDPLGLFVDGGDVEVDNTATVVPDDTTTVGSYGTVEKGDTLEEIAEQAYGDSTLWPFIAQANGITDPKSIQPGQKLYIPNLVAFRGEDGTESLTYVKVGQATLQKALAEKSIVQKDVLLKPESCSIMVNAQKDGVLSSVEHRFSGLSAGTEAGMFINGLFGFADLAARASRGQLSSRLITQGTNYIVKGGTVLFGRGVTRIGVQNANAFLGMQALKRSVAGAIIGGAVSTIMDHDGDWGRTLVNLGVNTVKAGVTIGLTSVIAGAITGATVGSAVPIVGTAVGFVVGMGVGWAVEETDAWLRDNTSIPNYSTGY